MEYTLKYKSSDNLGSSTMTFVKDDNATAFKAIYETLYGSTDLSSESDLLAALKSMSAEKGSDIITSIEKGETNIFV